MGIVTTDITRETYYDTELVLADAKTSTTDELANATGLDMLKLQNVPMILNVQVATADDANADETYVIELRSATDAAISSDVKVEETITVTRGDANVLYQRRVSPDQRYVMAFADVGGTTPSITYTAWLSPDR